jgi:DNA uptake protein ComE-like DNA-binding protein
MKNPGTDPEQTGVEIASKDKQTLVLFLLGLVILSLPFLSLERKGTSSPLFGIAQLAATGQWKVVCFSEAEVRHNILSKDNLTYQQFKLSPQIFDNISDSNYPAEFALFFNQPLPINRSRQEDLEMLPGIGPHLASLIAGELHKKGQFNNPEDLLEVPGIGPKILQRIQPLVSFEK